MPEFFGSHNSWEAQEESEVLHELFTIDRLSRVLAFCGYSHEDLEHNPVARNEVSFYLHVDREIERRAEVVDLEKQWNPLGRVL